jgi:hypothetical protein
MSLTKLSLAGNNSIIRLQEVSLVSDIPAGDGKTANLFYSVGHPTSTQQEEQGNICSRYWVIAHCTAPWDKLAEKDTNIKVVMKG